MNQIITDIIEVEYSGHTNPLDIEQKLKDKYGNIIRWAIVSVQGAKAKVSITYEQKFNNDKDGLKRY